MTSQPGVGTVADMSLAARDRMTADEVFALPDELLRAQLIDGELVVPPPPTVGHEDIVANLTYLFRVHRSTHPDCGHLTSGAGIRIDDHTAFTSDAFWVPDRSALRRDSGVLAEPPAMVIEVRSPSTWRLDRGRKLQGYDAIGVAEVWLLDGHDEVATVHRRSTRTSPASTSWSSTGRAMRSRRR